MLYQMLLQKSPFEGEDEDEIYDAIIAYDILLPSNLPSESVDILQKLLAKRPAHRLGSGSGDANDVMNHFFFMGINWTDVYDQKIQPPFIPELKGPTDVSNFDSEFTSVTPVLTPIQPDGPGSKFLKTYNDN